MRRNNSGFSLIELSIVLIIIGLLVVGSVKGYALYVSARVLRLNQEMTKYAFASEQFTAKYGSYPGILEDAVAKLGSKAKVKIDENKVNKDAVNGGSNPSPTNAESVNFFNHLSLAGLLDEGEEYIGTDSNLASLSVITPESKYYPILRSFKNLFPYVRGDDVDNKFNAANRIVLSGYNSDNEGVDVSILLSLDTKFDDGDPLNGFVSIIPDTSFGGTSSEAGSSEAGE